MKRLLLSYQRGDHAGFSSAARQLITDERRKHHHVLADELERTLDYTVQRRPLHSPTLRPLPKSKDQVALISLTNPEVSFPDLILPEETVANLLEIAREFRHAHDLREHGVQPRTRLLFVGPPGCGKSVTAEAVAQELGVPMAKVNLSTIVSSLLGETARNLESVFEFCGHGSWLLLFEELDSLAKERGDRSDHGEMKRVVAAFLQQLDDFNGRSILIATSNHPGLIDVAAWRRFDEIIPFDLPDGDQTAAIIHVKMRKNRMAFDVVEAARSLRGRSPAEIEAVCHGAIRRSVLDGRMAVSADDFKQSLAHAERRWRTVRNSHSQG